MRLYVAGGAGVLVVAPRPADLLGLFEDDEIVDAGLSQPDGHAQAAEARSDDDHADRLGRLRARALARSSR